MPIEPRPVRARATLDGRIIAESVSARRILGADSPPALWIPRGDVHLDQAEAKRLGCVGGDGELVDFVRFENADVRLELLDDMGSDDPRDATVTAFPNWGDLYDLRTILDVEQVAVGRYRGAAHNDWRRPVIEGSQLLAQTLVAAALHAPNRRAVSASMVFARVAVTSEPIEIELDEVSNGRTVTVLSPRITQMGKTCAVGTLLLDVTAPDVIRHHVAPPAVPGPYDSTQIDMSMTGRDVRIVDNAYTIDSAAPVGPPQIDMWLRFREAPEEQAIHVALATHITGLVSLGAAMRPHQGIGLDQAHRTLTTGVNAISLAIHRQIRANEWMLYHHHSTYAGDGMTHSECRIHDQDGHLLASFTVDAMLRAMNTKGAAADHRTVL